MTALSFQIPGPPVSKARQRVKGRQHFTDAKTRAGEMHISQRAMLAARSSGWTKTRDYVAVTIRFFYANRLRRDIDRAINAVLDGITKSGHVWDDDSQVDALDVIRVRGIPENATRTEVSVALTGEVAAVLPKPKRRKSA